jgi:hypothetical protein
MEPGAGVYAVELEFYTRCETVHEPWLLTAGIWSFERRAIMFTRPTRLSGREVDHICQASHMVVVLSITRNERFCPTRVWWSGPSGRQL